MESIPATPGHHVIRDQGTEEVELASKELFPRQTCAKQLWIAWLVTHRQRAPTLQLWAARPPYDSHFPRLSRKMKTIWTHQDHSDGRRSPHGSQTGVEASTVPPHPELPPQL